MLSIVELGVIPLLPLEATLAILLRSTGVCAGDILRGDALLSSAKPLVIFGVDLPEPDREDGLGECEALNENGDLDLFFFEACSIVYGGVSYNQSMTKGMATGKQINTD